MATKCLRHRFNTFINLLYKKLQPAILQSTVHPRLSEQVELKFLLGRSDTQNIRIIEEEHFTY